MKTGDVPRSGKRPSGTKGMTAARRGNRRDMTEVAQGWNDLEEWERREWRKRARQGRTRVRRQASASQQGKARTRALRAQELYMKINRVLGVCGYERRRLPPPPKFGANPVKVERRISLRKGRLAIKLGVRAMPVNDIIVFGSPPRRAGQGPGGNYAFLGLLPSPEGGESEITELYLTKLKEWRRITSAEYRLPLEGSRVCIRTWPQESGWEGKGFMQISHGLAPRAGEEGGRREKGQIKA